MSWSQDKTAQTDTLVSIPISVIRQANVKLIEREHLLEIIDIDNQIINELQRLAIKQNEESIKVFDELSNINNKLVEINNDLYSINNKLNAKVKIFKTSTITLGIVTIILGIL